jgi:hypothetical protein
MTELTTYFASVEVDEVEMGLLDWNCNVEVLQSVWEDQKIQVS